MALHLRIENVANLPDGGPVETAIAGKRGIDIGRDNHLDWTLPDPTRHISGKHAEIRYQDGGYWLHDVSTNGTFLNGDSHRMQAPRRLRTGDRFTIGHYIVAATVEGEGDMGASAPHEPAPPPSHHDLWFPAGEAPPPIDPRQLRARKDSAPVRADFLDWAADVPNPSDDSAAPPMRSRSADPRLPGDMDWARGEKQAAPEPPPPPEMPSPRRPSAASEAAPIWDPPPQMRQQRAPSFAAAAPTPDDASPTEPPRRQAGSGDMDDFIRTLARAAGVSEQVFARNDPQALAQQLGQTLRIVVDNLSQLLNARVQAKRMVRSAHHTVIQASDNNPLKFSPSGEEALRIMFGPPTRSYLDAHQALQQGFEDIKTHQVKTYSAMQRALTELLAEFDPQTIERETEVDRGFAAVVASRKAKLWDACVSRWQAKRRPEKGGLVDAFMAIFARHYDERRP